MESIFESLKVLLQSYEKELHVVHDKPTNYYLHTIPTKQKKKGEFFGAVQIKKNYVAFHLMPVYCNPDLLTNISEDLRARMQGKSCFNFKSEDVSLFRELEGLTAICFEDYKNEGKI